jgi:NAD(P)-dependent dehydrogenase (short-subunit alcohol dehydrogenase family)
MKALAIELLPILVNCIGPGVIETEMTAVRKTLTSRGASFPGAAQACKQKRSPTVVYLASDEAPTHRRHPLRDGGCQFTRFTPDMVSPYDVYRCMLMKRTQVYLI